MLRPVLRTLTNAPWFISNKDIYRDPDLPSVSETIAIFSERYVKRLEEHTNPLAINLLDNSLQTVSYTHLDVYKRQDI